MLLQLLLFNTSMALAQDNSPYIEAVDEYVPAPGQFINTLPLWEEGDDALTMAEKCTDAIAHNAGGMICLGAWGGYVTFHFDHPLVNVAGCLDMCVLGNSYEGNSEPGIIMVSKDENGNGLPDDVWYEISGSADTDSLGQVIYGYEVEYSLSSEGEILWTDNHENSGTIPRNSFHQQPYFPQWIQAPLTLWGTRLPDNAFDQSGNGTYWIHQTLRYGYADNASNSDSERCSINLDWAVDPITRQPVSLDCVHFVRIYSACLQNCGWLGETSTEVCGATDLHPSAPLQPEALECITADDAPTLLIDLWGRTAKTTFIHNNKYLRFIKKQ